MSALTTEIINEILNIKESFELPEKLMTLLSDREERERVFAKFLVLEPDLSFDWFTDYFQEGSSNRKKYMQDFTPRELTALLPDLLGDFDSCLDVCSGTGGLTVGAWSKNQKAFFVCEELSRQAFPLLLFNLAIRNVSGLAINCDTLTGALSCAYKLTRGETFSNIEQTKNIDYEPVDVCVTNPPYSLRAPDSLKDDDPRFAQFGAPPRDKADYAFVLHGMGRLNANGRLCAILPTGTLFRSKRELEIRKKLVDGGHLSGIVNLPEKLFLNTGIPVVLMLLRKSGEQTPTVIIDASQECEKGKKQNILTADNAEKITLAYTRKLAIEHYSRLIPADEIRENEYNLNIPRYVDTHIPEPLPDIEETCAEIVRIDREIRENARELYKMTKRLIASNDDDARQLACLRNAFAAMCGIKTAQAPQIKTATTGQASLFQEGQI